MKKLMVFTLLLMLGVPGWYMVIGPSTLAGVQERQARDDLIDYLNSVGDSPDNPWVLEPAVWYDDDPNTTELFYSNSRNGQKDFVGAHRATPYGNKIASKPLYVQLNGVLYEYESETSGTVGSSIQNDWGWGDGGIVLETCFSPSEGYSSENELVHTFHYRPYQ